MKAKILGLALSALMTACGSDPESSEERRDARNTERTAEQAARLENSQAACPRPNQEEIGWLLLEPGACEGEWKTRPEELSKDFLMHVHDRSLPGNPGNLRKPACMERMRKETYRIMQRKRFWRNWPVFRAPMKNYW